MQNWNWSPTYRSIVIVNSFLPAVFVRILPFGPSMGPPFQPIAASGPPAEELPAIVH